MAGRAPGVAVTELDEIAQMLRDDAHKALWALGLPERAWEACPEGERRYWRNKAQAFIASV